MVMINQILTIIGMDIAIKMIDSMDMGMKDIKVKDMRSIIRIQNIVAATIIVHLVTKNMDLKKIMIGQNHVSRVVDLIDLPTMILMGLLNLDLIDLDHLMMDLVNIHL